MLVIVGVEILQAPRSLVYLDLATSGVSLAIRGTKTAKLRSIKDQQKISITRATPLDLNCCCPTLRPPS